MEIRKIVLIQPGREGRIFGKAPAAPYTLMRLASLVPDDVDVEISIRPEEILAVHEALSKLESTNDTAARLVKLRYFGGLTIRETAEMLGISSRKANQVWAYARAWLLAEIGEDASG